MGKWRKWHFWWAVLWMGLLWRLWIHLSSIRFEFKSFNKNWLNFYNEFKVFEKKVHHFPPFFDFFLISRICFEVSHKLDTFVNENRCFDQTGASKINSIVNGRKCSKDKSIEIFNFNLIQLPLNITFYPNRPITNDLSCKQPFHVIFHYNLRYINKFHCKKKKMLKIKCGEFFSILFLFLQSLLIIVKRKPKIQKEFHRALVCHSISD